MTRTDAQNALYSIFKAWSHSVSTDSLMYNIQLLDETEQNIVIYQWRADQLFADAEGRGK